MPSRLLVAAVLVWLCLALSLGEVARAQNQALNEADYWQLIRESQTLVAQTVGAAPDQVRAQLHELAGRLTRITAITLPSGEQVAVNHGFLAAEEDLGGESLTADSALRRAQEFSGGGDYRTAVRYLYLSTLLRLEERGLLRYDRSLTNREYLQRVAHDPDLSTVLRDVVDVFDRVWYGYQPLDAPAYQRYATAVEALKHYRQ